MNLNMLNHFKFEHRHHLHGGYLENCTKFERQSVSIENCVKIAIKLHQIENTRIGPQTYRSLGEILVWNELMSLFIILLFHQCVLMNTCSCTCVA